MRKGFYLRLAAQNLRKNARIYVPFLITGILTVTMFYIICSLSGNQGLRQLRGSAAIQEVLKMGYRITSIFSCIFLFYTNSFLLKRRKKEFGLFNILGMEKRHIAKVLFWETCYSALITMGLGLLFGILLDKLMFLLVTRIISETVVPMGFYISFAGLLKALALFTGIYLVIFLNSLRQITLSNPIALLHGGATGEKEPKAKWFLALLGLGALGTGYGIAVTIQNPIAALSLFFLAAILVILGTYFLFTAGSIALLKLLRKNKRYYYRTKHFISVSGMIYRMKQNAVGLANICILSTMVLLMLSSTVCMMLGIEDNLHSRYPFDFMLYSQSEQLTEDTREVTEAHHLKMEEVQDYRYLSTSAFALPEGNAFEFQSVDQRNLDAVLDVDSIVTFTFLSLEDYCRQTGNKVTLGENEVLLSYIKGKFDYDSIRIQDKTYQIQGQVKDLKPLGLLNVSIFHSIYVVLPTEADLEHVYQLQQECYQDSASAITNYLAFQVDAEESKKWALYDDLVSLVHDSRNSYTIETQLGQREDYLNIFGGLFFIGIFLGILFTMAAILIIYYKQISEGYDDKERFHMMQKVGLSQTEVRQTIRTQILTVFFLPLIVAGLHIAFAFPIMQKILTLMNMYNTTLYILCTIGSFLVYALLYGIVYSLTAKTYYRIVKR